MAQTSYWIGIGLGIVGTAIAMFGIQFSFIASGMVVFAAIVLVFLAQRQPAVA